MANVIQLRVKPVVAATPEQLDKAVSNALGLRPDEQLPPYRIDRRSIDARGRSVWINLKLLVQEPGETLAPSTFEPIAQNVSNAPEVVIIGAGSAGLFAALELIEFGLRPIILERGKDVRARRRDLAVLNKEHIVDPDSNYCFGEGGAGTYSDGKLYTRSKKRGDIAKVLELLVAFGAPEDILIDAHPHIGTNKLPKVITAIREFIEECGGEVRFGARVESFRVKNGKLEGVIDSGGTLHAAKAFILATGHSARDIFSQLHRQGILIEMKPFALGVRVEHPQVLIDSIQYHCDVRSPYSPPSSYGLVHQVRERGVYSFCMCPGGIIAPCATVPGEVVTNGWSPSKRNNPFANSGIVVELQPADFKKYASEGPLAAMAFQAAVEQRCWEAGGGTQSVPAQRLTDFVNKQASTVLPASSYQPGTTASELNEVLPEFVSDRLRAGFSAFGKKMKGYLTSEAVVHATESRTSSPVRIPRNRETLEHPEVAKLYPCGEGGGYAGGIVSAAMDGQKVARAIRAAVSK
ncbi:MAG: FAD-binding protein [Flavobacteriales bacterium]|nr:FAD-binding protein [Flavobacteriales bacterium]